MQLAKENLKKINSSIDLQTPESGSFNFSEKVLQFGTGVLLRGLPDYFIDKANKNKMFNGRVVMVKSTSQGDINKLKEQDNLYTLCIRGLENGREVKENYLNSAVSRILVAKEQWEEVLACASSEEMRIVISNTTEVGIQLTDDDIHANPPKSYPGKLLAFLYARYQAFEGDRNRGMVVIPTELIVDNGKKLKNILVELAHKNKLEKEFLLWLTEANHFCSSLVDRIVPGKPDTDERRKLENQLGYEDSFMIKAEPYRLWAIEVPDKRVGEVLSFSKADKGVILAEDITKYRRLKLRLLNATHTFTCAFAYLSGFETVGQAMADDKMHDFVHDLMGEIANTIADENIPLKEALAFANEVADRFQNPYIVHPWLSISLQYSSKVNMRCVPLLVDYIKKYRMAPDKMARGLAAYIRFMRSEKLSDGSFQGNLRGKKYKIKDDRAETLSECWARIPENPVHAILSDTSLWDSDLSRLKGLEGKVEGYLAKDFSHSRQNAEGI